LANLVGRVSNQVWFKPNQNLFWFSFFQFHLRQTKAYSGFGRRLSFTAELLWLPCTCRGPFVNCVTFAGSIMYFHAQLQQRGSASNYLSHFIPG
jgi:hypothetical protein